MERYLTRKPVFMIGMPRSGTSIFSEAISLHENFGWLPSYLNSFPDALWLCLINRLTSISKVGSYFRGKKFQNPKRDSWLRRFLPYSSEVFPFWEKYLGEKFLWDFLIDQKASKDEKEKLTRALNIILRLQGKKRLFVKFTGPARIYFLNSIFSDACYINVLRDPRAVVSSLLKVNFWRKNNGLSEIWWQNGLTTDDLNELKKYDKSPVALAAIQWRRVVEITWNERKILRASQFYETKYEDFVEDPCRVINSLFSHFKLDDSEIVYQYISSLGKLYNMNFKYKDNLTDRDIAIIKDITNHTAIRAGYLL